MTEHDKPVEWQGKRPGYVLSGMSVYGLFNVSPTFCKLVGSCVSRGSSASYEKTFENNRLIIRDHYGKVLYDAELQEWQIRLIDHEFNEWASPSRNEQTPQNTDETLHEEHSSYDPHAEALTFQAIIWKLLAVFCFVMFLAVVASIPVR